jgi:hypothetical protein
MSQLKQAIDDAGGAATVAAACGVSPRAVYKWVASGCLPRTEYTGETDYADRIAALASARGEHIVPFELRSSAAPKRTAA